MNNNKKLSFAVDANQIDIKPLLKKDFLELSMRAISSANPNRNNSWFTKESMEKSLHTFVNKPILGYFENGDFVSHNGDWEQDPETGLDYWNTLGRQGERILGSIRESDELKITQDDKGLYWVTLTCSLWTQYSYKQVKRLLKDAKRAKLTGEATKNISVEVDIVDYEMLENGIMKINEFNLVGITILGSRNGMKVEPGIEDAELSVVDIMGRDVYEKQQNALRLAYEKLDDNDKNNEKEEFSNMKEDKNISEELNKNETLENSENESQNFASNEGEEKCPDCGKNPCECESCHNEANGEGEENKPENEACGDNKENEACGENNEDKENCEANSEHCEEGEEGCGHGDDDHDEDDDDEEEGEEDDHEDMAKKCAELQCAYDELSNKYEELSKNYNELKEKYESCQDYEDVKKRLSEYEHKDFMKKANELLNCAKISEELKAQFVEQCEKGEFANFDDLKVKVAVAAFDTNTKVEETNVSFSAPVSTPDTTSVFGSKAEKSTKANCWDRLREGNEK